MDDRHHGYLHQSEDAIVVGGETALRVAATITASEAGRNVAAPQD
jgi:hypothetical protein